MPGQPPGSPEAATPGLGGGADRPGGGVGWGGRGDKPCRPPPSADGGDVIAPGDLLASRSGEFRLCLAEAVHLTPAGQSRGWLRRGRHRRSPGRLLAIRSRARVSRVRRLIRERQHVARGVDDACRTGTRNFAGGISTADGGTHTTTALSPLAGDAPRTVEAWFRTTSTGCIFSTGLAAHAQAFSLCLRDGPVNVPTPGAPGVYFETYDADIFVPIGNLTDGTWHYLALTLTGNMVNIVIDGTAPLGYIWDGDAQMPGGGAYTALTAQPFALPYTPDTAATPLGVATAGLGGIGGGLVGTITDVAVYPSALPVSELVRHYRLVAG
jgi:hypothetical protein